MNRSRQLGLIAKKIREFYRTLKKEFNQILESEGMTNGEFLMLKSIVQSGNRKVSELAKELGVSMPYITSLSDKMVKKGFIERRQFEEDRRIVVLKLTKEGKKKYSRLDRLILNYMETGFDRLSDQELLTFEKILKKVSD
ncbi:MAG TPA: MarR family transcriptional regulator [Leptospiraceae bacterium]|nr:MarR family transcriptional regulator [Leptospiraceae bacterium]HMZ57334.1 MarR family transcriptional regulator [Leptospiraceae bacterium]HNF14315.1 MarR family transcriptional regulator [Leptospiraceae bacterium]HNF25342.1 MarR family transcriptional regulator [Leptospiraceae bacterium]HNH09838.1 MarR family transcriptional regulator [Leptospiraceae bacterium]